MRLLCLTTLFTVIAGCSKADDAAPMRGEIRLNSMFKAEFDLVDHTGREVTHDSFDGKPMFIYFGFTTCPEVCPAALKNMTLTLDRLGSDADAVHPIFITVDPKRDTPERLADHLSYDPRLLGLTGSEAALAEARDNLRVIAQEVPMPDSALGYTVDHSRLFYITDATGVPVAAANDMLPPDDLVKIIQKQL